MKNYEPVMLHLDEVEAWVYLAHIIETGEWSGFGICGEIERLQEHEKFSELDMDMLVPQYISHDTKIPYIVQETYDHMTLRLGHIGQDTKRTDGFYYRLGSQDERIILCLLLAHLASEYIDAADMILEFDASSYETAKHTFFTSRLAWP